MRNRDIPIVHRVIEVHTKADGDVKILTKGDNNPVDDRGLYAPGQYFLSPDEIVGKAKGCESFFTLCCLTASSFVPYIGMATILMNDYPKLKYALLIALAISVITSKE